MSVFWTKIKAACWHSLTMAWGYVLMVGGVVLSNVDLMASLVTDKQISTSIADAIGANPAVMGKWLAVVGLITTVARIRGIITRGGAA